MNKSNRILWLAALLCWSSLLFAGPAEDYETGYKAFNSGNIADAMAPLRRAADGGHAAAQALLAYILNGAEFNEEAAAYYRKSAEQGNSDGEFGLGSMYAIGEGVPQSFTEARKWVMKSASQGNKNAIAMLAQSYISGGLEFDEAARHGPEALAWIKRAAEFDYLPALINLSTAYRTGQYGLAVDPAMVENLNARISKVREQKNSEPKPAKK